jgi:hypothetical protein
VKELASRFVEVVAVLIGNDEFDRRSSTHLHVSDYYPTVLIYSGVGWLPSCGYSSLSVSSPTYSLAP